jgi:hypothetical protein
MPLSTSARPFALETGLHQQTSSRWLQEASSLLVLSRARTTGGRHGTHGGEVSYQEPPHLHLVLNWPEASKAKAAAPRHLTFAASLSVSATPLRPSGRLANPPMKVPLRNTHIPFKYLSLAVNASSAIGAGDV